MKFSDLYHRLFLWCSIVPSKSVGGVGEVGENLPVYSVSVKSAGCSSTLYKHFNF